MIRHFVIYFFVVVVVTSLQNVQKSNDAIGFPEIEENPLMANKQNRQPVYIPSICPENELFYPGDQADDWICDCRSGHLYHPTTNKCWPAYQKGPCSNGEYVVLPDNSAVPVCIPNPCKVDTFVPFHGKCELIGNSCGEKFPISVLWVDAVTLKIDCVKFADVESRFAMNVGKICPPGSRRSVTSRC